MTEMAHPGSLHDGVIELRGWLDVDVSAVQAAREESEDAAQAWIGRQKARPLSAGVSCAIAPIRQAAVGYVGLIRRPRLERGVIETQNDSELVFEAHRQIVGIGYWIAPAAQGKGFATRATTLLSRWALLSAGMIRVEALLDPDNSASRRVVEKSGFQPEGRLRSYLELDGRPADALIYSLMLSDV